MMMRAKKTGFCTSCAAVAIISSNDLFAAPVLRVAQDVLNHHHRAIHHHAEIERAQREQVCGNMAQIEQDRGEQQSERES